MPIRQRRGRNGKHPRDRYSIGQFYNIQMTASLFHLGHLHQFTIVSDGTIIVLIKQCYNIVLNYGTSELAMSIDDSNA